MAVVGKIHFRDLDERLELHKVVVSPASDTTVEVWGKVYTYLPLTYWTAESVGFVIQTPTDLKTSDWTEWYFVYAGLNYYFHQFSIIHDDELCGQLVFIEGRSPHFSDTNIALGDLETYDSDAAAAAAGLAVGDYYRAGLAHDRADAYSITSRIE